MGFVPWRRFFDNTNKTNEIDVALFVKKGELVTAGVITHNRRLKIPHPLGAPARLLDGTSRLSPDDSGPQGQLPG